MENKVLVFYKAGKGFVTSYKSDGGLNLEIRLSDDWESAIKYDITNGLDDEVEERANKLAGALDAELLVVTYKAEFSTLGGEHLEEVDTTSNNAEMLAEKIFGDLGALGVLGGL